MKYIKSVPAIIAGVLVVFAVLISRYETGTENTRYPAAQLSPGVATDTSESSADQAVGEFYRQQQSGEFVTVAGRVIRTLPDDTGGDRHQRFIIELESGQTLLVSHNIDLAPRINGLELSDQVTLRGEYEWNDRGGIIHWTHHDPDNRQKGGWIEHEGRRYH